ncbi:MAG TPA: DNA-directed RNA polymerase subunit alpha [Phycisphaerae bacterium]|nr:DNA-directed RNA polymerase subunit alpha [Phycisphaerae bacterium]HPM24222.1 DNA-directed RNA polymerase subunit alpha [Phycisphaerae bacterium]
MRIRWRGLELPTRVVRDDSLSTDTYGRFTIEPFERGFGTTVGNSLRRILLSSLEGSAVTHARIAGADHEFTSLPGVLEDVTDIILNIKDIVVALDSETPKTMRVERREKGPVRAGDFQCDPAITVQNPDLLIATLTDDVNFSAELTVARGRGYVPAAEHTDENTEIGVIPVDALYSPVTRVRYRTEDTRVGQRVNYDRLVMEIWTKGTTRPEDALVEAAKILRKHLNPFVQYFELGAEVAAAHSRAEQATPAVDDELRQKLERPIASLELSVRASNCLDAAKITTIGELVRMTEHELLQLRSFGKTSLMEVRQKLADCGLSLGLGSGGADSLAEDDDAAHSGTPATLD